MNEKLHKILYIALSLLLAVAFWLFVDNEQENTIERPFNGIPVEFIGAEDALPSRNLMLSGGMDATLDVVVRGPRAIVSGMKREDLRAQVNVSNINSVGTYPLSYTILTPDNIRPGEITTECSRSAVTVQVSTLYSRTLPVSVNVTGDVVDGCIYMGERMLAEPSTLTISGRAELVNQVAYAKVVVTGENRTESVNDSFPFQLIGASGDPLDLDVTCDVDTVYTVFPIRATAEIPLDIKVAEGGGLGREDVRLKLSARSITVAGSREAVAALSAEDGLLLGTIDLAALEDDMAENGGELTFPVPLADELENLSGITEVTVELKPLKRVETRTFDVATRISTTNVPEGWRADIITQVIPVKVRGPAELLDELTEENIQVVANLGEIRASSGQYTVPVVTYLYNANPATELGVVRANYTITVSLEPEG